MNDDHPKRKTAKERGNYPVRICLKKCGNRDKGCAKCVKFSEWKK